jgi:hypothetical protein
LKKGLKKKDEEEGENTFSGLAFKVVLSIIAIYIGWRYLGRGRKPSV